MQKYAYSIRTVDSKTIQNTSKVIKKKFSYSFGIWTLSISGFRPYSCQERRLLPPGVLLPPEAELAFELVVPTLGTEVPSEMVVVAFTLLSVGCKHPLLDKVGDVCKSPLFTTAKTVACPA